MANKETKLLVENFRMFLKKKLSEAPKPNPAQMGFDFGGPKAAPAPKAEPAPTPEPAAPAKPKRSRKSIKAGKAGVIKIFDFGGTLFQPSHPLLKNPFFYLSLTPEGLDLYDKKLESEGLNSAKANMDKVDSNSYVVSRVSSFGPNKDREYFKSLVVKGDAKLKAFMELLGMPFDEASVDKYFLDGNQTPDTMKEFISKMTGIEPAKISVVSNLTGNSKGSEAEKIAKQNPGASFIIYDNDTEKGLPMVRNALENAGVRDVKEVPV